MTIPDHLMTEANIQAEFYSVCRDMGMRCSLELSVTVGRLDVAIFSWDWLRLVAIVECKKNRRVTQSPQIQRYKALGVPVFGLGSIDGCRQLAYTIRNFLLVCDSPGILWHKATKSGRRSMCNPRRRPIQNGKNITLQTRNL